MFTIKTHNPHKPEKLKFGFYVLNKGMNAGKPNHEPFRNSFVVLCNDFDTQNKLFWACHALHLNDRFRPYLHGSCVQTIFKADVRKLLTEAFAKLDGRGAQLLKTIKHIGTLHQLAKATEMKHALIQEAKGALLAEIFIKTRRP